MKITFDFLEEAGYASVTDYCRDLMKNAENHHITTLEVYRGEMLCLTVSDVREAAKIMPSGRGWIKYDKTKRKASREAC